MQVKAIGFPSIYFQGPGALGRLGDCLGNIALGGEIVAVVDPFVVPVFEAAAAGLRRDKGIDMAIVAFSGECTRREIDRVAGEIGAARCGAVVGAGGGKALDTAKAVAHAIGAPVVIVPTVASSDAPTSRIAAIYDENHRIVEVPRLKRNPDAVIVDTTIIVGAPKRFYVAGIGDAITKKFEVSDAREAGIENYFDAAPTRISQLLADTCYDVIRRQAKASLGAFDIGQPTPAFEEIVEATVLYSGLAFEGGGLSIAHGMLRGLTAYPQTGRSLHGELVTYGLMVQLALSGKADDFLLDLKQFLDDLNLPTRLAHLGMQDYSMADIRNIAELTFTAPYVSARRGSISPTDLEAALMHVETLSA